MRWIVLLFLAAGSVLADESKAVQQATAGRTADVRDASGRATGSSQVRGSTTEYRDASGTMWISLVALLT